MKTKINSLKLNLILMLVILGISNIVNASSLTVTLTRTNVTCLGSRDGSITATCTDGVAPYTYMWSNEAQTQTISNLSGGYYHVVVTDANNNTGEAEITLTEPEKLITAISTPTYTNGYNLTCRFCTDGRVNTSAEGGVPPYSYLYSDGAVIANRADMHAGNFQLLITDANGCSNNHSFGLSAPDRDDWQTLGNSGSNPATQFIGTTDNKDLVFKSYATERLRIKSNGDIKASSLIGSDYNIVVADANGILKRLDVVNAPDPGNPIAPIPWYTTGNNIGSTNFIGPVNNQDFVIKTGSASGGTLTEKMRATIGGKVSIGIPTTNMPGSYKLYVADGILAEKVKVAIKTTTDWSDYVFHKDYKLRSLPELKNYIEENQHLPDVPSAEQIVNDGGVDLGKMVALLLKNNEEQALYIIGLSEQLNELNKKIEKLQNK